LTKQEFEFEVADLEAAIESLKTDIQVLAG
jgi:hypothetical protein